MGCYVKPADESPDEWLRKNGVEIAESCVPPLGEIDRKCFAVCCVDNGHFAAAGIAFDQHEYDKMMRPDFRPKRWYLVLKTDLRRVSTLADMEKVLEMERRRT